MRSIRGATAPGFQHNLSTGSETFVDIDLAKMRHMSCTSSWL